MHTVTFYSYKGGVGRTLALVNAAADIARRGEDIFLIDFDIEAPGLQTFEFLTSGTSIDFSNPDAEIPGLTDLVLEYMQNPSQGVPDIDNFVAKGGDNGQERLADDTKLSGDVWFLPAGTKRAYERISWVRLYEELDGFMFFEALKRKIEKIYQPSWMFVDSRTGRAETTGICTRQLADTNVFVFFPNIQNRLGFQEVFEEVRDEPSQKRDNGDPRTFLCVASRVPTSDDEDKILAAELKRFAKVFDIQPQQILQLPHNNSLTILQQQLFAIERENSALGQAYKKMISELLLVNEESLAGALEYFEPSKFLPEFFEAEFLNAESFNTELRISSHPNGAKNLFSLNKVIQRADRCARNFPDSEELSEYLGFFYRFLDSYKWRSDPSSLRPVRFNVDTVDPRALFHEAISMVGAKRGILDEGGTSDVYNKLKEEFKESRDVSDALSFNRLYEKTGYGEEDQNNWKLFHGNELLESIKGALARGLDRADLDRHEEHEYLSKTLASLLLLREYDEVTNFVDSDKFHEWIRRVSKPTLQDMRSFWARIPKEKFLSEDSEFISKLFEKINVVDAASVDIQGLDEEELMALGSRIAGEENLKEAIVIYEELERRDPEDLAYRYNLTLLKAVSNRVADQAEFKLLVNQFEAESSSDPNHIQCFAIALHLSGDISGARSKFGEAMVASTKGRSKEIFSSFTYTRVSKSRFVEQCTTAIASDDILGLFFSGSV